MDELHRWAEGLEAELDQVPSGLINRIRVIAETASTQDAALATSGGQPGLLVVAGRQSGGRGRLGRAWCDDQGKGIAMSLVLDAEAAQDQLLPMRMGVATMRACEQATGLPFRLRWPNDVLEPGERGRKVAGVLIEVRSDLSVIGIGINVHQNTIDWPNEIQDRAVSLKVLGYKGPRLTVAQLLLRSFLEVIVASKDDILSSWRRREWLIGKHCVFNYQGQRIEGCVLDIVAGGDIVLQQPNGLPIHLASAQASLCHDECR